MKKKVKRPARKQADPIRRPRRKKVVKTADILFCFHSRTHAHKNLLLTSPPLSEIECLRERERERERVCVCVSERYI